ADTVDLVATLLPTGGVTAPGPPQDFGAVRRGAGVVTRTFTFTADPGLPCGAPLVATLALADGSTDDGTVSFVLRLGGLGPKVTENYSSGALSIRIPASGPLEIPIEVTDEGIIANIDAGIRINDSRNANLAISLV